MLPVTAGQSGCPGSMLALHTTSLAKLCFGTSLAIRDPDYTSGAAKRILHVLDSAPLTSAPNARLPVQERTQ